MGYVGAVYNGFLDRGSLFILDVFLNSWSAL